MSKILIFGHQNPDTDAITSAISLSYLQNQLGKNTEPVRLGEINEETAYALNQFKIDVPRIISEASSETKQVMLVDHNEFQQSISDVKELEILAVVDHHRLANFETGNPLYYRSEPVGCTNTIILKLYKENNIDVPKDIAGLMLSAIISDSLLFKSPTCTKEDVKAAEELAEIAGVDANEYGLDMLKAGTNLSNKSVKQIINGDAKTFPMGEKSIRICQVNTVDVDDVLARQEELEEEMTNEINEQQFDLFILIITNILDGDSTALIVGNHQNKVKEAFEVEIDNNVAFLPGVVSRKKQVVPQLTRVFTNL